MGRTRIGGVGMNLYDIAIARKLSGGGGGGGSSDFDKAIITVVNNSNLDRSFSSVGTGVYENGELNYDYCGSFIITDNYGVKQTDDLGVSANAGETASTQTIYIVPQKNFVLVDYVDSFASCTISGSAEKVTVEVYGTTYTLVVVTGDCTITISE